MINSLKNNRKLNSSLTRRVIELHSMGYDFDFMILANKQLRCLQNNEHYPVNEVMIRVVDQGYDQLTNSYKYVHAIDTCNGGKGVLITEAIFTNSLVS